MSFEQGALDIGSVGCTTVYHDWTPKESPLCRTHAVLSTYFTQDLNFSQSAGSNKQLLLGSMVPRLASNLSLGPFWVLFGSVPIDGLWS
ncbi:hypothetical protein G6F57_007642 [Rhizopus arrhizus]|uniref:Uncharacterized protein n=1 Tax=Rhizopus oryzae TaxID=64495 RepID=A0A9P6X913_RHIOR|nr:hypothetical protein G6F30_009985 [Rhizopus arrhizus]KAG1403122.1 hypothetical protein G6F58_010432 [Rhizopus delemar]KAG0977308.1 hypothetical protein G6F29_010170 [Rhizopus arrhizus]KAG0997309.1 hypothetical protein G6F28_003022 [Rhizopus arrhizus]KAG1014214.1 hypothetical protein G6F27_001174 [Rhizopus arrhizus]